MNRESFYTQTIFKSFFFTKCNKFEKHRTQRENVKHDPKRQTYIAKKQDSTLLTEKGIANLKK